MNTGSQISSAKKAIIIGATSGIGRALAQELAGHGYELGLTGRRTHLLEELEQLLSSNVRTRAFDVADQDAQQQLQQLIEELGGMDMIIVNAGYGSLNPALPWSEEKKTIETNVLGFTAMANAAFRYFVEQGGGHLVAISSIAAIRGGEAVAYNASKSFVSNYLQGLRYSAAKAGHPITITDIQPGFVDTPMAQGEGLFWVASPEKAAHQIFRAIERKKKHAYITKRWRLIAWLLKLMPESIYNRL